MPKINDGNFHHMMMTSTHCRNVPLKIPKTNTQFIPSRTATQLPPKHTLLGFHWKRVEAQYAWWDSKSDLYRVSFCPTFSSLLNLLKTLIFWPIFLHNIFVFLFCQHSILVCFGTVHCIKWLDLHSIFASLFLNYHK